MRTPLFLDPCDQLQYPVENWFFANSWVEHNFSSLECLLYLRRTCERCRLRPGGSIGWQLAWCAANPRTS